MRLDAPGVLVVGLAAVVLLAVGAVLMARRRARALAAAGATAASRPPAGLWCTIAGLAVLALAAAGPVASVPVPRSAGTVVLAMDVSNSMGATDVRPTRLAAAKRAARAFIDAQPDSVDIGVVAFERGALTTARPDADHAVARAAVDRLAVTGGTSLRAAVLASLAAITGKPVVLGRDGRVPDIGDWPSATVVLISDGEDRGDPEEVERAATVAQDAGVHIDTVGVGTAAGAVVDADGFRQRTKLDAGTLTAIARTTGGRYRTAVGAAELAEAAASVDLRLTVSDEDLPLAGALTVLAVLVLLVGAALTLLRSGRFV